MDTWGKKKLSQSIQLPQMTSEKITKKVFHFKCLKYHIYHHKKHFRQMFIGICKVNKPFLSVCFAMYVKVFVVFMQHIVCLKSHQLYLNQ